MEFTRKLLSGNSYLPCFAPDDGSAPGGTPAASSVAPAADGGAAPAPAAAGDNGSAGAAGAEGAPAAAKPASLLGAAAAAAQAAAPAAVPVVVDPAKVIDPNSDEGKALVAARAVLDPLKAETPAQKDLRLKAETPEGKAAREAAEATVQAADVKLARARLEALKAETPEQKTAREKAETPEQKAAREADEATVKADDHAVATAKLTGEYAALKLPEGMPADQPAFLDFKKEAASRGVTTEAAQALIDTVAPALQKAVNAPYEAWAKLNGEWIASCENDKEFGGEAYQKNLSHAARAINHFGNGPEVIEALNLTGGGNHPALVRWMVRVGKSLGEGAPANGGAPNAETKSLAEKMYGTTD